MALPLLPVVALGTGALLLLTGKKKSSSASSPSGDRGTVTAPPSGPRYYTVATGDYPGLIAQKLTGYADRWQELVRANPQKPVWTAAEISAAKAAGKLTGSMQTGNFKTLYAGEKLILPESW